MTVTPDSISLDLVFGDEAQAYLDILVIAQQPPQEEAVLQEERKALRRFSAFLKFGEKVANDDPFIPAQEAMKHLLRTEAATEAVNACDRLLTDLRGESDYTRLFASQLAIKIRERLEGSRFLLRQTDADELRQAFESTFQDLHASTKDFELNRKHLRRALKNASTNAAKALPKGKAKHLKALRKYILHALILAEALPGSDTADGKTRAQALREMDRILTEAGDWDLLLDAVEEFIELCPFKGRKAFRQAVEKGRHQAYRAAAQVGPSLLQQL
ncbi:MAG: hypothetical protein ACYTGH_06345 [Planctomycetota bacterium]|jgi:hypothetical protein